MKTIILTQDYEIFFGKESGTVGNCMIKPNAELMGILQKYSCTMTVFWDVLHYYTLKQNVIKYPELQSDITLIENQINQLVEKGHDIQLHIHSHWLDAIYSGDHKWSFTYDRYSIHNLAQKDDKDSINSILGCVNTCVDLLNNFKPKEEDTLSFRAGGYHLEPFHKLVDAFKRNSIYIDSSIVGFPKELKKTVTPFYHFSVTPSEVNPEGEFIEFPIASIKIPLLKKILFKYLRSKYNDNKIFGDGRSVFGSVTDGALLKERFFVKRMSRFDKIKKFVTQRNEILTPENSFKKKFYYLVKKAPDSSVMTLHQST